jgi:hypothetical protein
MEETARQHGRKRFALSAPGKMIFAFLTALLCATTPVCASQAQTRSRATPRDALVGALSAACSENPQQFSMFLLAGSRRAFLALAPARQKALLKRFALTSMAGHARIFLDTSGQTVLQCNNPAESLTFRLLPAKLDRNVAFIPVQVSGEENTEFGLVRQPDGWRLFSLDLLVINVPELVRQWQRAEMAANEVTTIAALQHLARAVKTYHEGFGRWPETLVQLGPSPSNTSSPERAQLVSASLASGVTDGYRFRLHLVTDTNGDIQGFELAAVPEVYDKTGRRSFFLGLDGKLHAADKQGAPATEADPVITPPENRS